MKHYRFTPGEEVEVRNAYDAWIPATAATEVEGTHLRGKKIHDFPVVWVDIPGTDRSLPWPAEDVRPAA